MADVTKKILTGDLFQIFTDSDAGAGDTLLINASLGKNASEVNIAPVGGNVVVAFNTYIQVFGKRLDSEGIDYSDHLPNLTKEYSVQIIDDRPQITIGNGSCYSLDGLSVSDIHIVSVTATSFEITVS